MGVESQAGGSRLKDLRSGTRPHGGLQPADAHCLQGSRPTRLSKGLVLYALIAGRSGLTDLKVQSFGTLRYGFTATFEVRGNAAERYP